MGVRMEGGKARRDELHAAVVAAVAAADAKEPAQKNAQKLKTTARAPEAPLDIAAPARRPGGQPGNGNALKSGYHSAEQKTRRRLVRSVKRRANAAVAAVEGFLREQRTQAKLAAPPGGREAAP